MKHLLLTIGILSLVGCSAQANQIQYVVNQERYIASKTLLLECMQQAVGTRYYGLDRLRQEVQSCEQADFERVQFKMHPESFYVYSSDSEGPYAEFSFCASSLASSMWDFPPEATTSGFRNTVQDCINTFPNTK